MPNFATLKPVGPAPTTSAQPNFATLKPVTTPTPTTSISTSQSLSDSIWNNLAGGANAVTNTLGLGNAVNTLGSAVATIGNAIDPRTSLDQKIAMNKQLPAPTPAQAIGTGAQIGATMAGAVIAPESVGGAIGAGALLGGAQGAGGALAGGSDAKTVAIQGAKGAAIGATTSGAIAGIGALAGKLGDKIQMSVIRPSLADTKDGFNINTLKTFNLGGTLNQTLEKSQSALQDLSAQLNEKLQGSDATINLQDVYNQTAKQLTSDKGALKNFGMNTKLSSSLDQLQNEIGSLNAQGGLSIPDAQLVKQAAGGFGAWSYGRQDPESKASEAVYNAFYSNLKTAIEKNSPAGVADINKQMSQIIPVVNAVIRRIPVAERNNALSLSDMIGLVGSTFHPAALGPTLINLLSKSGAVGNALSKAGPAIIPAAGAVGGVTASGLLGSNTPTTTQ